MPKAAPATLAEPSSKPAAKLWPLRRVLTLVAFLLLAPIVSFQVWDRVEAARFWRRIDAIEQGGQPVRYEPRRPATDEQKQAARLYAEAMRVPMPANTKLFQDAGSTVKEIARLTPKEAARDPRLADLRAIEAPYDRVLELLDRATPLDAHGMAEEDTEGRFPNDRLVASVNAVRIARLAFSGDGEGAASALLASLRIRRALPSTSISFAGIFSDRTAHSLQLVLNFAPLSPARLHALQQEYAQLAAAYSVEQQLALDRAQFLTYSIPGEFGAAEYTRPIGPAEALGGLLIRPLWTNRVVAQLDDYEHAIQAASQPWPAKLEATRALEEKRGAPQPPSSRRRSFLGRLLGPRNVASFTAARLAPEAARSVARANVAAAALAIARYHRAHGALPASLADVKQDYGPLPSSDPFTGAELHYVRDGDAFKVYSVGLDREDDGGKFEAGFDPIPQRPEAVEDIGMAIGVGRRAS